jgi:hypothetical protein
MDCDDAVVDLVGDVAVDAGIPFGILTIIGFTADELRLVFGISVPILVPENSVLGVTISVNVYD